MLVLLIEISLECLDPLEHGLLVRLKLADLRLGLLESFLRYLLIDN